jgi:hypothetical protein
MSVLSLFCIPFALSLSKGCGESGLVNQGWHIGFDRLSPNG